MPVDDDQGGLDRGAEGWAPGVIDRYSLLSLLVFF